MADGRHVEKSTYRHISVINHLILIKLCTQQQILNLINVTWSKMKTLQCTDSEFDRTYFLFLIKFLSMYVTWEANYVYAVNALLSQRQNSRTKCWTQIISKIVFKSKKKLSSYVKISYAQFLRHVMSLLLLWKLRSWFLANLKTFTLINWKWIE